MVLIALWLARCFCSYRQVICSCSAFSVSLKLSLCQSCVCVLVLVDFLPLFLKQKKRTFKTKSAVFRIVFCATATIFQQIPIWKSMYTEHWVMWPFKKRNTSRWDQKLYCLENCFSESCDQIICNSFHWGSHNFIIELIY